jgi:hypothetical protein
LGLSQSTDPWHDLQALRRGRAPLEPVLEEIDRGQLTLSADVLAAVMARLDRSAVERLLQGPLGRDPSVLLEAARRELAALADDPGVRMAWVEPLLAQPENDAVLEVLGCFQDPRIAARLHRVIQATHTSARHDPSRQRLLPLLGRQRRSSDADLLLALAQEPGPLAWRRAGLEALALGLSAWPQGPLGAGLRQLATDLDAGLAADAVDLLSRLPDGQRQLRQLQSSALDPAVAERLRRRLQCSPLVLVVHGRQGGVIPEALQRLAAELEERRQSPVVIQALTAEAPAVDSRFKLASRRAGVLTLVPLLLLPGEHARSDVPAIAAQWRDASSGVGVRRHAFLGAWPAWQRLLASEWSRLAAGRTLLWLHHPLEGGLAQRYLSHLSAGVGYPGMAVSYSDPQPRPAAVLAPLTLAPNRLSESLKMERLASPAEVLPPLLELPAVRDFLLSALEVLP